LNPQIPASEWLQTHAFDRAATEIGNMFLWCFEYFLGTKVLIISRQQTISMT
jgi:hypothetical protein